MPTGDPSEPLPLPPAPPAPPATATVLPRDELVALVSSAHRGAAYRDSAEAGRALAAQSKLPKVIAENLGAGFGQWDFFPEIEDLVDFALAYAPPASEEEVWAMARAWASDDARGRQTPMVLVGREILQHELRRIEIPQLRELFDEVSPARAHALRARLGLDVPAEPRAKAPGKARKPAGDKRAPGPVRAIPTTMPKPEFKRPPPPPPPSAPRRFAHPKFGAGTLASQDGEGPDAKLTITFAAGSKTLLARYVTEVVDEP